MRLLIDSFAGMVPIIEASKRPVNNADTCENCRFDSGSLSAYGGLSAIPATIRNPSQSIYLYQGNYWFSWTNDVDVVASPINDDAYARVYFTGDGYPKMTANTVATGSGTMPAISYRLGVKQPSPPTIQSISNNDQNAAGQDDDLTRFYTITYVNEFGEESMPSVLSEEITIQDPSAIVTVALPSVGTNDQNITTVRIYRTNDSADAYQLAGSVNINVNSFVDDGETLGIVLDSWTYAEPVQDMKGLCAMANGILAGFSGNTIYFSEAYLPHAWPVDYQQTTQDEIVAIAAVGNSVIVGTKGNPYIFSGVSPDAISGEKLEIAQACVSKQSMVDMGQYAIYASPDGLVLASSSSVSLITSGLFNKKEWQKYEPSTIKAEYYEEKYVAFYGDGKGFIFDPRNSDFVETDFTGTAMYNDLETDTLYIAQGSTLSAFDENISTLSYSWSKTVRLNNAASPSCAYVDTINPDNVGMTISVDGVELLTYESLGGDISQVGGTAPVFRLPAVRGREFTVTITGTADVHRVAFGTNMKSVQHG